MTYVCASHHKPPSSKEMKHYAGSKWKYSSCCCQILLYKSSILTFAIAMYAMELYGFNCMPTVTNSSACLGLPVTLTFGVILRYYIFLSLTQLKVHVLYSWLSRPYRPLRYNQLHGTVRRTMWEHVHVDVDVDEGKRPSPRPSYTLAAGNNARTLFGSRTTWRYNLPIMHLNPQIRWFVYICDKCGFTHGFCT